MKFNKTFKKSISIILSIIMILSTFGSAIVPAGAANTSENTSSADTYYFWYSEGVDNINNWTKKIQMTANGDNTYYCELQVNTGYNLFFTINKNSSPKSTPWSSENDITNNVTYDSSVDKSSNGPQKYDSFYFARMSLGTAQKLKFTFTPTKKVAVSLATGSQEDSSWYATGRFGVKNDNGTWTYAGDDATGYDAKSKNIQFTKVSDTLYSLDTNATIKELSTHTSDNDRWYFKFYNGSTVYCTVNSTDVPLTKSNAGTDYSTGISTEKGFYFNDTTDESGNVILYLNTAGTTPVFYFEVEGSTTEKTWYLGGQVAIKDSNGNLKWASDVENTNSAPALTSQLPFTKVTDTSYKLETGLTLTEYTKYQTETYNNSKWYMHIVDGTAEYSVDGASTIYWGEDSVNDQVTLSKIYRSGIVFNGTSDKLVTIWLDTTNESAPKVYFTLEEPVVMTTKEAYVASKDAALWFDAAPSKPELTTTLVKWNNKDGASGTKSNEYVLYIPKDVTHNGNTITVTLYNGYDEDLTINSVDTIPANDSKEVTLTNGQTYTTSGAKETNVKVMQGSSASIFFHTTNKDGTADYDLPTKTDGSLTSKSKVEAKGGECITLDGSNLSDVMKLSSVKGRGNSSWEASYKVFGKYAYNMKLKEPTNLLNLPMSKSYCLLANNADESMLRNALTYDLAKNVGLYDSPEFKFVDMYDNGEYHGTYFICEKVDVGEDKLIPGEAFDDINESLIGEDVIDAAADAAADDENKYGTSEITVESGTIHTRYLIDDTTEDYKDTDVPYDTQGTYLLEFEISDRYKSEASWFISPKGQHVVVKSPEYATKQQVEYVAKRFAEMEAVVYDSKSTLEQMKNHIDVDSFAKMYLIQELSSNLDSAATSYYITFDCSGNTKDDNDVLTDNAKFVASPVWDYDWAYGQYNSDRWPSTTRYNYEHEVIKTYETSGWYAKEKSMDDSDNVNFINKRNLQAELASHSAFQPVIKKCWYNGFYTNVTTYATTTLKTWKGQIADSMAMNENRWGFIKDDLIETWGSKDTGDTLADAVTSLENWLINRSAWLNTQFQTYNDLEEDKVEVPNVTGMTQAEATTILVNAGFKVAVSEVYHETVTAGLVISSDPTGNTQANKGSTVKVIVSKGQESSTEPTTPSGTVLNNVKVYFKGTNLKSLTPSLTINGTAYTLEKGDYIGTYYNGSYRFYWWTTTISEVTVGQAYNFVFKTSGSSMLASATIDFSVYNEADNAIYLAVDNMQTGTELVNISNNNTAKVCFRSSANMITNVENTFDPNKTLAKVMMTLFNMDGTSTTKKMSVGDTNADGNVNIKDATLAQMMTAGIVEKTSTNTLLGDYDISGDVNIKDATGIQSYIVNS